MRSLGEWGSLFCSAEALISDEDIPDFPGRVTHRCPVCTSNVQTKIKFWEGRIWRRSSPPSLLPELFFPFYRALKTWFPSVVHWNISLLLKWEPCSLFLFSPSFPSLLNSTSGIPASLLSPLLANLHVLVDFLSNSSDLITPLPYLENLHSSPLLLIKVQTLPTDLLTLCLLGSFWNVWPPSFCLGSPIHQAGRQDPTRCPETRSRERV